MNRAAFSLHLRHGLALVTLSVLSAATLAAPPVTNYEYDANGNLTAIKAPLARTTSNTYDARNRLETSTAPAITGRPPIVTRYGYDGADQLQSVTDPRSVVTSYTVDGLGNQSQELSNDRGATNRTYDEAGNLKTSTDARGKTTTYKYDSLNRLTRTTFQDGKRIEYNYDEGVNGIGRLTSIDFPPSVSSVTNRTSYTYDADGNLASKTDTHNTLPTKPFAVLYGWSGTSGRLETITYPSGKVLSFSYDDAGQVLSVSVNGIKVATNISYVPFGPVKSWNWGDGGLLNERLFDTDGRMTQFNAGPADPREIVYDEAGRITRVKVSANNRHAYEYDALDRLTRWEKGANARIYGYDDNGNREDLTVTGSPLDNYTNAANSNRLLSTTGPSPARSFQYDLSGNITSDGQVTYTYDDAGRMTQAQKGTVITKYFYDGFGQRVRKVGTTTNYYVYDESGHLIGTYDANGVAIQEYVYLGDMPLAVLSSAGANQMVHYIYTDQIMKPWGVTDVLNQLVWKWDSPPFGEGSPNQTPTAGLGTFTFNLRFPGQHYDKETGLFYNYFRDYDPQTGRYVQSDPIGLESGSLNNYAYVDGVPTSIVDPFGLTGYFCKRSVWGLPGDSGWRTWFSPSHHYLCVTTSDGGMRCGGQTAKDGNWWGDDGADTGPGAGDYHDPQACTQNDGDNYDCYEKCVLDQFDAPRPRFSVINSDGDPPAPPASSYHLLGADPRPRAGPPTMNCQKWTDDTVAYCKKICYPAASKKPSIPFAH